MRRMSDQPCDILQIEERCEGGENEDKKRRKSKCGDLCIKKMYAGLPILLDIFEKRREKPDFRVFSRHDNLCFPRTYANLEICTIPTA